MDAADSGVLAPAGHDVPPRGTAFAIHHRHDHNFFLSMVALIWIAILMGFVPDIIGHLEHAKTPYPWIVHVHALVFVGWLCLLTTQVLLVRKRNIGLHRKLGKIAAYWAAAIPIVGTATAIIVDRASYAANHHPPAFLSVQLGDLVLFAIFTGMALVLRKRPAAHKRLMILAVLCMVDAGFARWWNPWLDNFLVGLFGKTYPVPLLAVFLGNFLLMFAIAGYDLITRGRLHRIYTGAMAFAIAAEMGMIWLLVSPWWKPLATRLIGY